VVVIGGVVTVAAELASLARLVGQGDAAPLVPPLAEENKRA
jgi:hypothetical protein